MTDYAPLSTPCTTTGCGHTLNWHTQNVCTISFCDCLKFRPADADQQARTPVGALASREQRRRTTANILARIDRAKRIQADEATLLRTLVDAEQADGDQAREQLAAARAGDAPWIKAYGEDIEQGRAEARRNPDAWRNAHQRAVERTAVLRGTRSNFERVQERVAEAEATLTAVRKQAADWARLAAPGDVGATPDDTAFAEAGHIILAALGDPQPATEPDDADRTVAYRSQLSGGLFCPRCAPVDRTTPLTSSDLNGGAGICCACGAGVLIDPDVREQPAVCCVCGCPDVTYRNCNEQPFCCRCAACCDPPVPCEHGCQPPTEPEAEREPGWAPATCRRMDTRTCPPSGPCPGPCARFESDDPTPWEQPAEPVTGAAVATDSAGTIFTLPGGIKPAEPQQERRPNCRCIVTPAPPAVPDGAAIWAAIRPIAYRDLPWWDAVRHRITHTTKEN